METDNTEVKIAQLRNLLDFNGYHGEVHINGIEQGSLTQVIKSCIALRESSTHKAFQDPIELTHFSYNADKSRYLQARFFIELAYPGRYRINKIVFENHDLDHKLVGRKVRKISSHLGIPSKEKARLTVTPKEEKQEKAKGQKL